jgi:hypothetical protein
MNDKTDRRRFLQKTNMILGAVLVAPAVIGTAAAAETMFGRGGADGYLMETTLTRHCGTCEFWGGPRRVSEDSKTLTTTGLGWCNNPSSPNYQKLTSPDHGPMDTWRKWRVLGGSPATSIVPK